jgi:prepilin peptidase CpaA
MRYPMSVLGGVTVLLAAAAAWDIARRRIPNGMNVALALAGLTAASAFHGLRGGATAACAGLLVIAILWLPWSAGKLGGGDVKVAAAAAVWVGLPTLVEYVLASAIAGGGVAIACLVASAPHRRLEMARNLGRVGRGGLAAVPLRGGGGRVSVPFGVAFALGALVCLWREGLSS